MNRKLLSVAGLIVAAVLFVAVNVLSSVALRDIRLDLTENQLYTLSDGTRSVLRSIEEPITLRLFYSQKLAAEVPQIQGYGNRVRELLEEYAALAGDRIRLEVIDPEPFSEAEDRAVQAGIQGVPLDQGSGRQFYFGLAGSNAIGGRETIPFFQQEKEQFLEYDLTKLVYALAEAKKPVLAVLSDLPLEYGPGGIMAAMRGQSRPYAVYTQLRQQFEVKTLAPDVAAIDPDVDVLLVAHPKTLTDQAAYAIDQFVLRGGRALVFVDPHAETDVGQPGPMGMPNPAEPRASDLPRLFKAWGVELVPDQFVADRRLAIRVNAGEGSRRMTVEYVPWLALTDAERNADDVVTAELGTLNLATAGALRQIEGATTTFEPLLTSSAEAALMPVDKVRFAPEPEALLTALQPTGERYVLAARVSGPLHTAFPDGPPATPKEAADEAAPPAAQDGEASAAPDDKPEPAALTESAAPANIIVVADADMLDDRFWVRVQDFFGQRLAVPIAANADFVINAVDNLGGSNDLISLRSRGRSQRPFELVDQLRRDAGQQFLVQEQALQQKLEQTQKQLAELQSKNQGGQGAALLSAEEQAAIDNFRRQLVATRGELREVQHSLNRDIERLETQVKFANIGLMPLVVATVAVLLAAWRHRSRRRRLGVRD